MLRGNDQPPTGLYSHHGCDHHQAADLKGKRLGITRIGSANGLALRTDLEHLGLSSKDVAVISMGGIPDILAGMRAGAINGGILSAPTSTAASELTYRPLVHIPIWERNLLFQASGEKGFFVQAQPNTLRGSMAALTDGAKICKEDDVAAVKVFTKIPARRTEHSKRGKKNTTRPFPVRPSGS